jgi:N-acetylmuramoyl-L-alanine amidase
MSKVQSLWTSFLWVKFLNLIIFIKFDIFFQKLPILVLVSSLKGWEKQMTKRRNLIIGLVIPFIPCVIVVILLSFQKMLPAYASPAQVTVIASELNVREDADISSKIIGLVHRGDTFEVIQTKNNWDQIKLTNNQTGWVSNAFVTSNKNIEATVEAWILNVREQPSLSSPIAGKLIMGATITVSEEQGGWAKIVSGSGIHGWVYSYYISKNAAESQQTVSAPPTTKDKEGSDSSATNLTSVVPSQGLKGKTVVLDPGHGGIDVGTTSITGTHEKDLTLATAKAVEQKLKNAGVNVIMTRDDDTFISLKQRSDLSNRVHADAFISFHYNWANDPTVSGLTDFYYNPSRDQSLASDVLNGVVNTTGLKNMGTRFDDLYVLRNNTQPCVLIELGFLSNKQDDAAAENTEYNNEVAQGVYSGLLNYFSK